MSKLQFYSAIPDTDNWVSQFAKTFEISKHAINSATFVGLDDPDMHIDVTGKNLQFKGGELVGGKVTGFEFSYEGHTYVEAMGTSLKAADVQLHLKTAGILVFADSLERRDVLTGSNDHDALSGVDGNDRINGRGGDDIIHGGTGNDRLTGGGGSDVFRFSADDNSRDVITDFDANGGPGDQDLLDISAFEYHVEKFGKTGTLLMFDNEEVVLLGVKPSEIDGSDFVL